MILPLELVNALTTETPQVAWEKIIEQALETASRPITRDNATNEVVKRDREIGVFDHFLSTIGWDLWEEFGNVVERTSDRLVRWWNEPYNSKAILILDGLSLRELPWLLQGAKERGFTIHDCAASASELPGETNQFAKALGFSSRSQLQNNGGGMFHKFNAAVTESVAMPWADCAALVNASPNWLFWHHWPDDKLHDGAGAGQGLEMLTKDAVTQLTSDDFWNFVERLAVGRRLVITSDHGYAATGYFSDSDGDVGQFLKQTFSSGRNTVASNSTGPYVPPIALNVASPHGSHLIALGRRKWKSQGGYPTLTHGGLSLLEVLSPFVELSKQGN